GIDLVADAHALPFPDRSFDSVIAIEVFEHLYDPKLAASEIHRVLRSGGEAVVTVPFMFRVHGDPQDYQRFTSSGLEALFGGRFQTGIQPFGNRLQVISDLLPTSAKFMAVFRFLNHILCIRPFERPSSDCASGYIVVLKKVTT
ncbi:MAG: class I SAM-dependent methyltransferase, partial [Roseinatronobacter sp.]